MSEVLRADWFDLADDERADVWAWLHGKFLPALRDASGIAWVGHYEIIRKLDRPNIRGRAAKRDTDDPAVPPGWQNVILTAAASPEPFFGPHNPVDSLVEAHADRLAAWRNHRIAVFIEEQCVNGPEQRALPYGMGPPPAMQLGNFNTNSFKDDFELARWYRGERFPRVSVTRGMIRGRKMLSIAGWPKHGVLWEFTELEAGENSYEHRFVEADRNENWRGRRVTEYVTHAPHSPNVGRRVWPKV